MVVLEPEAQRKLPKKYISVDIESSGPTPGKYTMLSFGACIVGDTTSQFYRELKPISEAYIAGAMRIGCLGLSCIADMRDDHRYDPSHQEFLPPLVLARLRDQGSLPSKAMAEFDQWIRRSTAGYRPVLAAAPIGFDGMWIHWYFDNFFAGENPLGFGGEDINSMYRGLRRDVETHSAELRLPREGTHHNALDDAIYQAKEMEAILRLMREE
jgi:hypothetical protein